MEKTLKVSYDTATRWFNGEIEEFKLLAVQLFPELAKKELPKTWEELENIKGFRVNGNNVLGDKISFFPTSLNNINLFATKEQAEASIALAQLSQLREVYRNGWVPDFNNKLAKYVIHVYDSKIQKGVYEYLSFFLSFQDEETRDLFLENFRDLIEKAKPLL